ncbi:unnamed protein product, partial [Adineta ricciae]
MTFSTGIDSGPWAIVHGDFNNDNQLDIVVTNYQRNSISLLMGNEEEEFSDPQIYSTGNDSRPTDVVIADLNNDQILDILVTNSATNNIGVFFGYDNGTFANQITFSTGTNSNPIKLNCVDFNGDHFLDIFVFNKNLNEFVILFGFNNGSFLLTTTYSLGNYSNPESFAISDINNDEQLDVIVANSKSNTIDIFNSCYSTGIDSGPSSVAVGDLNNDKYLDLVVANNGTNNIAIFYGSGDGSFSSKQIYSTGRNSQPNSVVIGDLNNDNQLDIVVSNCKNDNIGVFLGYGNGSFASQKIYSTGISSRPQMLFIEDLNDDTYLDVAVISTYSLSLTIFLNNGNGTLSQRIDHDIRTGLSPNSLAIGDLNKDGHQDLVVTTYYGRNFYIFQGFGNGTFENVATYSTGSGSRPYSCVITDWSHDNNLDIIVSNCVTDNLVLFKGYGNGTFSLNQISSTGDNSCPRAIRFGYFYYDDLIDIAVANYGTNTLGVFFNNIYTSGERQTTYSTGSSSHPRGIVLAHFNNDFPCEFFLS